MCSLCGAELKMLLVTNDRGRPRILLKDETALYLKQEAIDDCYFDCCRCGQLCFSLLRPVTKTGFGMCTDCGGTDTIVLTRPLFGMSKFASKRMTCVEHVNAN